MHVCAFLKIELCSVCRLVKYRKDEVSHNQDFWFGPEARYVSGKKKFNVRTTRKSTKEKRKKDICCNFLITKHLVSFDWKKIIQCKFLIIKENTRNFFRSEANRHFEERWSVDPWSK